MDESGAGCIDPQIEAITLPFREECVRLRARVAELEKIKAAAKAWADSGRNNATWESFFAADRILAGLGPDGKPVDP